MKNNLFSYSTILIFIFTTSAFSQSVFMGFWEGKISVAQKNIDFQIKLEQDKTPVGRLSIPEQNAFDLNLKNIKIDSAKIFFSILPLPQTASFSGSLITKDSISGNFSQRGINGTFFLKRVKVNIAAEKTDSLENGFIAKDVFFYNGKIKLAGTLTLPDTLGKFPAVVLLTGSGAQNRDENIFGFKIFKIIADNLTNSGYAVLRFDDRGIGGSTSGKTVATTADYAEDALSAVQFLETKKNIDKTKIGLLGHSEGGLAAIIAASASNDVAFIILMAAPSISGGDLVLYQMKTLLKSQNVSQAIFNKKVKLEKEIIAAIKNNENLNTLKNDLFKVTLDDVKKLSEKQKAKIKNDSTYANQITERQLSSLQNPWIKFFFSYNPTDAIESLNCPVLILFGGKDMQVPVKLNKEPFISALKNAGNNDYKIVVFPKANHLFQSAKSGLPNEYKKLKKNFVKTFIPTIVKWLNEKVKVNN